MSHKQKDAAAYGNKIQEKEMNSGDGMWRVHGSKILKCFERVARKLACKILNRLPAHPTSHVFVCRATGMLAEEKKKDVEEGTGEVFALRAFSSII